MAVSAGKNIFRSIDWVTILLYIIFIVWGWFTIFSATYKFDEPNLFNFSNNSGKQMMWIGIALALGIVVLLIEKRVYEMYANFFYAFFIILLIATMLFAPETKGSRSWIPIGSVKFQPAEFAKFSVALVLGQAVNKLGFSLSKWGDILKAVGIILFPLVIIIMQKETGSALVYLAFLLVLYREGMSGTVLFYIFAAIVYFVVGIRFNEDFIQQMDVCIGEMVVLLLAQLFTTGLTFFACRDKVAARWMAAVGIGISLIVILFAVFVIPFNFTWILILVNLAQVGYLVYLGVNTRLRRYYYIAVFAFISTIFFYFSGFLLNRLGDHQRVRIEVLLGKKSDKSGAEYNVNQALIAIGSGGLTGKGYLDGTQTKLSFVPEQETDFIFCTIGEEGGFIQSTVLLLLFLFFILRLIWLSERQPDTPGRVYGYSVVSIFIFHLFINIGMVLGLTPVIGIPLPFFSYGGSSLIGFTILLFIFLRMDAESKLNYKMQ